MSIIPSCCISLLHPDPDLVLLHLAHFQLAALIQSRECRVCICLTASTEAASLFIVPYLVEKAEKNKISARWFQREESHALCDITKADLTELCVGLQREENKRLDFLFPTGFGRKHRHNAASSVSFFFVFVDFVYLFFRLPPPHPLPVMPFPLLLFTAPSLRSGFHLRV